MVRYSNIALRIVEEYTTELQKRKAGILGEIITVCYKQLANKKNLIQRIVMDPRTLDITYLDDNDVEVSKNSLSAGEKQLMVIAILWALAICSKKRLPVIIDTPLSRLDSMHRTSLVTTYFPQASDQTIILSTDSEIDHNYYELMKDFVGDEFTLIYSEETRSTTILKGYFQEQ
jgi:DNA sulfur modification protein DndD